MAPWPCVPLSALLNPTARREAVDASQTYRLLGVRLDGGGAFHRETVSGSQTAASHLFRVAEGDFIYSKLFAWRGAFGLISRSMDGAYVSSEFPTFRAAPDRLDPQFLRLWFRTPTALQPVIGGSSGSTALTRNRLNSEAFLRIAIPLPPLEEQRRIVARIEDSTRLLNDARQLRASVDLEAAAVRPGFVTRLFSTLTSVPSLPISSLGIAAGNPIQIGPFGAQLHRQEFTDAGVPVLNVGNVWPEGLRLDHLDYVTPQKARALRRYTVKAGDLLFARSGATLGKVCIVPEQCDGWLMTGHLFRVRFDPERVLNSFAFAALRDDGKVKSSVMKSVRGATRPGYNTTLLGAVELPVPSLEKQSEIVARITVFERSLAEVRRLQRDAFRELNALHPCILDRAFKGEL